MRRRLPFVTVGLFAAILSIIIGVYAAATYQTVRFDTLLVDSGLVREGQQVRARFRFRNDGRSGAAILNLAPTCGVRAALVRGRTVASGEDGALEIRIDTSGRQGPVTGGVAVTLRDPFQRVVVLTVKTIVDPEFVVGTPIVDFGRIARDAPAQRTLRIRPNKTEYDVLSARSTDESFDVYVEPHRTGEVATLVVNARPQSRPGLKFGTIRVASSSPHMPQLIVPVRAVVDKPS